jgi:hypothetical protein
MVIEWIGLMDTRIDADPLTPSTTEVTVAEQGPDGGGIFGGAEYPPEPLSLPQPDSDQVTVGFGLEAPVTVAEKDCEPP